MSSNETYDSSFSFRGKHIFAQFYGVRKNLLNDQHALIKIMRHAVETTGATILNEASHLFSPEGVTAVYLLSESHASIHTYPSHCAAFIDIFTCGSCEPNFAIRELKKALKPARIELSSRLRKE